MKAIIILVLLCNYSLPEASTSDVSSPRMSEIQGNDSVITNDLRIRPFHLEIIPPSSGVQFYRNGIIYLSHSKLEEKVDERHISFGSVKTYASLISDTIPGDYIPFTLNSSTLFPSEATTFSVDFNTMYLSLIPEKSSSEKIFRAQYTSDGWKIDEKPLEICNDDYIYSHPCLSADGTFMVFSSNRSGTSGGLDLWITMREGEGWSNPENLGGKINSSGNELFAAMDSKNNIYYSSDGHPGKGGYDILIARFNGTAWDEPHFLPDAINTQDDELAYTINKTDNKTAFFTTRTRSGRSRTKLYVIDLNKSQLQDGNLSLGDRILALSDISTTTTSVKKSPAEETSETKKKQVFSDKPVQPVPDIQISKEVTPAPDNVPETLASEVKKELVPQQKAAIVAASSDSKNYSQEATKEATVTPTSEVNRDKIVYRVQILANTKPVGSQIITVSGKSYKSFEYLYKGGYRTTIGEFGNLKEAILLQNICRKNGYSQAFVVAFKNNIRSIDPELFK